MSFSRFIANRIYFNRDKNNRRSRPAIVIAMLGIAVGIAVMIISIAVVMGFKGEVASKVIGFGSDIQVLSLTQNQNYKMMPVVTNDSLIEAVKSTKGVKSVAEFVSVMGMLKTDEDFLAIQFKGYDDKFDMDFFERYLVEGSVPDFSNMSTEKDKETTAVDSVAADSTFEEVAAPVQKAQLSNLLISKKIAATLHLKLGQTVYAYFVESSGIRARKFNICGIYETHLSDYDKNIVITDINVLRKLNNWKSDESTGLQISVTNFDQLSQIARGVEQKVNHKTDRNGCTYGTFTIKELAPSIFSWLGVLDTNVVMILVLMICVAAVTIVSGLLIIMLERIHMIGVLKALGADNFAVRKVFVRFSIMLVGRGLIYGNLVALLLCFLQNKFHFITLDPGTYYLEFVPISYEWFLFLLVNILTLVISSIVILGSSFLMSLGKPADTMRFD